MNNSYKGLRSNSALNRKQKYRKGLIFTGDCQKQQVQEKDGDSSQRVTKGLLLHDEVEVKQLELIQSGGWMKVAAQTRVFSFESFFFLFFFCLLSPPLCRELEGTRKGPSRVNRVRALSCL